MLKEGTTTITATTVDGGFTGTMELTVTPALNRAVTKKMNRRFGEGCPGEIDRKTTILAGRKRSAIIRLRCGAATRQWRIQPRRTTATARTFNKWNAWNKGLTDEQMEQLLAGWYQWDKRRKRFDTTKYETAYGVPTTRFCTHSELCAGPVDG